MAAIENVEEHKLLNQGTESASRLVSAPPGMIVCGHQFRTGYVVVAGIVAICVIGCVLGFALPPPGSDPSPWDRISAIIGWWYFTAWGVSFLPQLYLNFIRKSVVGQSFDYVALNVFGFAAYSVYTISFYAVKSVKDDYHERFGNENTVDLNDVGFAVYAFLLCVFNTWQIFVYDRGNQRYSLAAIVFLSLSALVFVVWLTILLCGVRTTHVFNKLDILYGASLFKLIVTLIKYLPQIYLNFQRKLTVGWNIWNVLLDFTGGSLSVVQMIIDCWTTGRWNGIEGNIVKFFLGLMSIVYDLVFMCQHYCLYKENNIKLLEQDARRRAALLEDSAITSLPRI